VFGYEIGVGFPDSIRCLIRGQIWSNRIRCLSQISRCWCIPKRIIASVPLIDQLNSASTSNKSAARYGVVDHSKKFMFELHVRAVDNYFPSDQDVVREREQVTSKTQCQGKLLLWTRLPVQHLKFRIGRQRKRAKPTSGHTSHYGERKRSTLSLKEPELDWGTGTYPGKRKVSVSWNKELILTPWTPLD